MENKIKIGDFIKLTRSTLKTVIYYHKIGLLQEPARSLKGYRLYGPVELTQMRLINYLKSLGFDLKRIKLIMGNIQNTQTMREVLEALKDELILDKKNLEEQIEKIELLLVNEVSLENNSYSSETFQMAKEILGPDNINKYVKKCPERFDQQGKIFSILDDFQWLKDNQATNRILAEYFKTNPQQYETALSFAARLAGLAQLSEDDPEIETLARESAEYIKSTPLLKDMLYNKSGPAEPYEGLLNEMVSEVLTPAQMKHKQLLQKYLNYHTDKRI